MLSTPAGDKLEFKCLVYTPAAPDGDMLRDREQKTQVPIFNVHLNGGK